MALKKRRKLKPFTKYCPSVNYRRWGSASSAEKTTRPTMTITKSALMSGKQPIKVS